MHQIYSCSDENLEVFTVISSKSCSPARRRAKASQHILAKSVRKIFFPLPILFFSHSTWLRIPSKVLWVNGKQIFQGKEGHPCLMQRVGWETEGGAPVQLQFIYRRALKKNTKKQTKTTKTKQKKSPKKALPCRASQNEHSAYPYLRESQTSLLSIEPSQ
uniref:Vexin n=1 Tax=Junco hyemalis TaxID=40217 RepID=A0A8C5JRA2_JUNHY